MKCLQSPSGEISRVSNAKAEALVKEGWRYVAKKEWKWHRVKGVPMPMPTVGHIDSGKSVLTKAILALGSIRRV